MYKNGSNQKFIPKWFVANCSSMLSFESVNGVAIIPALLLSTQKKLQ